MATVLVGLSSRSWELSLGAARKRPPSSPSLTDMSPMINSYMKRAGGHIVTGHVTTEFCMDDTDSQWQPIHNLLQRVKTKNTKRVKVLQQIVAQGESQVVRKEEPAKLQG